MTHNDDSTMAASEAAGAPFKEVERKNKSKRLKPTTEQKIAINRTYNYTIRLTFPAPRAKAKFNPLTNTRMFFQEMLKHDSSITVTSSTDSKQIVLASDAIPTNEAEFNQFFKVSTDTRGIDNKSHVIIGCHIASDRTLNEIKFDSTSTTKFVDWLKKERIFAESDSLGINKTATIGYLTKIHTRLTNRGTLKELIADALSDVHIDPDLACELDPSLKTQQTDAMTNGDVFVPAPPSFEIYQTEISYGRDKKRIKTDVLGVKCAIDQARLLKEFFPNVETQWPSKLALGSSYQQAWSILSAPKHTLISFAKTIFISRTSPQSQLEIFSTLHSISHSPLKPTQTSTRPPSPTLSWNKHGASVLNVPLRRTKSSWSRQKAKCKQQENGWTTNSRYSTNSTLQTKSIQPLSNA